MCRHLQRAHRSSDQILEAGVPVVWHRPCEGLIWASSVLHGGYVHKLLGVALLEYRFATTIVEQPPNKKWIARRRCSWNASLLLATR